MARAITLNRRTQSWRGGGIDIQTSLLLLLIAAFCYSAWLTSIVFCASNGSRPLLIASATSFPIGIVHGIEVWRGGSGTRAGGSGR